eukprot:scaffold61450_cov69-Phaeocystis_antarctica.AAC.4
MQTPQTRRRAWPARWQARWHGSRLARQRRPGPPACARAPLASWPPGERPAARERALLRRAAPGEARRLKLPERAPSRRRLQRAAWPPRLPAFVAIDQHVARRRPAQRDRPARC